jgi:hypothetical protein
MTWKIQYRPETQLPKLMWLAVVQPEGKTVTIFHGSAVECHDDWMVEGVWDNEFSRGEFHRTEHFFGSGIRIEGGRVYCVASSALVDRLFYCVKKKTVMVSNSLIALLAFTGSKLDRTHDYNADSTSILQGLEHYRKEFKILNTEIDTFYQVYHENIVIGDEGISFESRTKVHEFASFEDYYGRLNDVLVRIRECYSSPARRIRLDAFTTISSGYDSTAVASLAKSIGVKTCFTSKRSNSHVPAWIDKHRAFDDGGPIAAALGMKAIYLEHEISSNSDDELYFYAVDPSRTELVFHAMADHIEKGSQGAVVFTGYHGDKMWDSKLEEKYLNDHIIRGDISGVRLSEIRLKSGFINVAVPFIFAKSVASISRISDSPEMEPWRLHNSYDRPIPRRIAESAGVERRLFGFRKKMVSKSKAYPSSAQLRKAFLEYLEQQHHLKPGRVHASVTVNKWSYVVLRAFSRLPPVKRSKPLRSRVVSRLGLLERNPIVLKRLDMQGLLFIWSVDVLTEKTAEILQKSRKRHRLPETELAAHDPNQLVSA